MNGSQSKSQRTRRFIIETTAGIFNAKGYEGTSLSDLTEATGLTKGSIYGNFDNKEEVALAAFDHNLEKIRKVIVQRMAYARTYHDKLLVYAEVYQNYDQDVFPGGGCPILNTATDADDTNELLKDKAARAVMRWKKGIGELIQAGITGGEFKSNVNAAQVAFSIIALIEGGIMIAKVTDDPTNMNMILKTVETLVAGLKA